MDHVAWIESLLLGSDRIVSTPQELKPLELRLLLRGISVSETTLNGGLVQKPHLVAGDLDRMVEYFEHGGPPPEFRTGTVTRVFNHLLVLQGPKKSSPVEGNLREDEAILESILSGPDDESKYEYSSAEFWGKLARRLLNERRPWSDLKPLAAGPPNRLWPEHALRLYDVTAKTRGEWFDPLDCVLVPRSEYVDATHFADVFAFETFLSEFPTHPLTRTLRTWVSTRILDRAMECRPPPEPFHHGGLEILLENAIAIDRRVRRVDRESDDQEPPKLVDVFQRLVATCGLDYLWRTVAVDRKPDEDESPDHPRVVAWQLTRKLEAAERQNKFLVSLLKRCES